MKQYLITAVLIASLSGPIAPLSFWESSGIAIAKPPSWAPAHGYRRKHEKNDKREERDEERREERYEHRTVEENRSYEVNRDNSLFYQLDTSRNGVISRNEWNMDITLFERLDRNHDGVLSQAELDRIDEERGLISGFFHKIGEKVTSFLSRLW